MISPPSDKVSLVPFLGWQRMSAVMWRSDFQAGVTVATFAVPQAMAYATLAGVPPVHGLYAAGVMALIGALWGSSPFVNTGPTNTAALLTASALGAFALQSGSAEFWRVLWLFTVLVGVLRLLLGLLKAGPLVRLVPEHALVGFVTAADLLIALGQFHEFLGIPTPHGSTLAKIVSIAQNLPQIQILTLGVGVLSVTILLVFDRFSKKFPVALGAIVLTTLVTWMLNARGADISLVRDIAPVPFGLPSPQFFAPDFGLWMQMLPAAFAVAAIGLLEAVSISSALALKKKQRVNFNQEFFGQGVAQIAGAVGSGFPGSASYSRSALIERNGGQTAWANIFFALVTLGALLLFPKVLESIPLAALAGLLLFTGLKLVDLGAIRRIYATSRADFGVVALTFCVTFFGKLEWGFFVGVVGALAVFVTRAKELHLLELVPRPTPNQSSKFDESLYTPASHHERSEIVALALHGDLFFGQAHELREQLAEIVRLQEPRFLVIRLRRAHSVDAACWNVLFEFAKNFVQAGGKLYLCGLSPHIEKIIVQTGLCDVLPPDQLISRGESAGDSFETALERIAPQIAANAILSAPWRSYFSQFQLRESVSLYRDSANDGKTWGFNG